MAFNLSFSFGRQTNNLPTIDNNGNIFYSIFNGVFNKRNKQYDKLNFVLNNPVAVKVLKFIADNYSVGKYDLYQNGVISEKDFFYEREKPNDWQTWDGFFWDYAFWISLGTACLYKQGNIMYFLNPQKIKLTTEQEKKFTRLTFSKYGENTKRNTMKGQFDYEYPDGTKIKLELSNLHIIQDFGSVSGSFFFGNSRIDALYDILRNAELTVESEQVNLEYTKKFLISGQQDRSNINDLPMSESEKQSIEQQISGNKTVHATKSRVDVRQMVSNLDQLKLTYHYSHALHIVGNMYGIPKDLLEALDTRTSYENQEKSLGRFVDYTLKPIGQKITDLFEVLEDLQDLRITFEHLPFNKVFDIESQKSLSLKLDNIAKAKELGLNESIVKQKIDELYN